MDVCVLLSSPVFEGGLCFRMEAEESKNRFRRRVGMSQMSCKGQRTQKIALVHFHRVPWCVTTSKASMLWLVYSS